MLGEQVEGLLDRAGRVISESCRFQRLQASKLRRANPNVFGSNASSLDYRV
jgi:hypothetical protein